jgi:amidase
MTDLALLPSHRLLRLLDSGAISSRELAQAAISRITGPGKAANAVVTLDERALAMADRADARRAQGAILGPLHGLPITVKDAFETEGLRTTSNAPELADNVPDHDALAVARLRAAGAIVIGKTNLAPWADDNVTCGGLFGDTPNPWDPSLNAGGSSGGSAAAVALGLSPLDLGSDIGGSLRQPASWCGVFALKPSWGVVPTEGHLHAYPAPRRTPDVMVAGPIARCAEDLDLALSALLAPDETGLRPEPPHASPAGARGLRLAVWTDDPSLPLAPDVRTAIRSAADTLVAAGAQVDEVALVDNVPEAVTVARALIAAESSVLADLDHLRPLLTLPDSDEIGQYARMHMVSHREWAMLDERRRHLQINVQNLLSSYDALLCPVFPTTALPPQPWPPLSRVIRIGDREHSWLGVTDWCVLVGVLGLPVVAMPIGTTPGGLPVGVQVVTRYLRDRQAIGVAARLSSVLGGYQPPPSLDEPHRPGNAGTSAAC